MRCAKCGEVWHQEPSKDVAKTLDAADEVRSKPKPPPAASRRDEEIDERDSDDVSGGARAVSARRMASFRRTLARWRLAQVAGFAALALFVGGTFYGLYTYKDELVAKWPATASLFDLLNEPVNPKGMEFQNVTYEHQFEDGLPVLAIRGEVVNVGDLRRSVPRVRVGLRDERRRELYAWTFAVPETALEPEGTAEFITRLSSPPANAYDLEIRFVEPDELASTAH